MFFLTISALAVIAHGLSSNASSLAPLVPQKPSARVSVAPSSFAGSTAGPLTLSKEEICTCVSVLPDFSRSTSCSIRSGWKIGQSETITALTRKVRHPFPLAMYASTAENPATNAPARTPPSPHPGPWNASLEWPMLISAIRITRIQSRLRINSLMPESSRIIVQDGPGHCSTTIPTLVRGYYTRTLPENGTISDIEEYPFFPDRDAAKVNGDGDLGLSEEDARLGDDDEDPSDYQNQDRVAIGQCESFPSGLRQ
ncbi:hypothetical protein FB45DRAFT_1060932 [Roridomyces roridus]|uniref:Uncharacterized protein n=1 Tax=Roridomyces roridus TaxID=1738132 RepID=A0AAD7BLJ3_9AGAR|nr:hypothetical protein FB45DRAFT_1060932 [Roridomyces roridus]